MSSRVVGHQNRKHLQSLVRQKRCCLLPTFSGSSGQGCGSASINIPVNAAAGPGGQLFLEGRYGFALRMGKSTCRISAATRWLPTGFALILAHGALILPFGTALNICHLCSFPPCCNPKHLVLGTPYDNHGPWA